MRLEIERFLDDACSHPARPSGATRRPAFGRSAQVEGKAGTAHQGDARGLDGRRAGLEIARLAPERPP